MEAYTMLLSTLSRLELPIMPELGLLLVTESLFRAYPSSLPMRGDDDRDGASLTIAVATQQQQQRQQGEEKAAATAQPRAPTTPSKPHSASASAQPPSHLVLIKDRCNMMLDSDCTTASARRRSRHGDK